ncbi:hypothetical protein [Draconibacterium sp.]|uniref:hypothetical protein n=1 Tax=Draconibacterium sp. TaxID=1965318 RepID=UPI003567D748
MADVTVNIEVSNVSFQAWLRTSYISLGLVGDDGKPMILNTEMGPDQVDAFENVMEESAREVLKVFLSRQGDVTGVPFEYDGSNAIYRFREEEPVLAQGEAIKSALNEDVKNALYMYTTSLWLRMKNMDKQADYMMERYHKITDNINIHLYKLHD